MPRHAPTPPSLAGSDDDSSTASVTVTIPTLDLESPSRLARVVTRTRDHLQSIDSLRGQRERVETLAKSVMSQLQVREAEQVSIPTTTAPTGPSLKSISPRNGDGISDEGAVDNSELENPRLEFNRDTVTQKDLKEVYTAFKKQAWILAEEMLRGREIEDRDSQVDQLEMELEAILDEIEKFHREIKQTPL